MSTLYLLIGGNQGNRRQIIAQTTDLIRQRIGSVVDSSYIYETAPWGTFDDGDTVQSFYNQALKVKTLLTPHEALNEAQRIERILGRRRKIIKSEKWKVESNPSTTANSQLPTLDSQLYSSRPIDVDLIFYDTLVMVTNYLTLPHPRMHLRRFVLMPMCDIAADFIHPVLNKTLKELLNECADTSSCTPCC